MSSAFMQMAILTHSNLKNVNLAGADLCDVDLSYADLRGANLAGTHLDDANIRYVNGNGNEIKSVVINGLHIAYTTRQLAIDNFQNSHSKWRGINRDELNRMGIYFEIESITG